MMPSIDELSPQDSGTHTEAQTPEPRGHRNCFSRFMLCGRGAAAELPKDFEMAVAIGLASGDTDIMQPNAPVDETKDVTAVAGDGTKIKGRLTKRPPPIKTPASRKRPTPPKDSQKPGIPELPSTTPEPENTASMHTQGDSGQDPSNQVCVFFNTAVIALMVVFCYASIVQLQPIEGVAYVTSSCRLLETLCLLPVMCFDLSSRCSQGILKRPHRQNDSRQLPLSLLYQ